jgi:hypothetical protein
MIWFYTILIGEQASRSGLTGVVFQGIFNFNEEVKSIAFAILPILRNIILK